MVTGWRKLHPYLDEDEDSERWVLDFIDAEGRPMQQFVGFTRTAMAPRFTRERIEAVLAEHEARVLAEGGTL